MGDWFLLSEVWPLAEKIVEYLKAHEAVDDAAVVGSIRRRCEIVRDIDIIIATRRPEAVLKTIAAMPGIRNVEVQDKLRFKAVLTTDMPLEGYLVAPDDFAGAIHFGTGSKTHYDELQQYVRRHNLKLPDRVKKEQEIYQALGLSYIEPELREGLGEIRQAEHGKLPHLIAGCDLKGVFHVHTSYSDGLASIKEMAAAVQKRGWSYLGIADHSQTASYAHGLKVEAVLAQRREIDKLNEDFGIYIFAGIESDILPDGSLDYPDKILAQFDFVIASVHSAFRQGEAVITKRIVKAMTNKYVTMLGHPTGRLLLARKGYGVNIPAVISAAAATGTIIEINASPRRLDLDWRWYRQAKEQKVMLAINPDAHAIGELDYVSYGVAAARKGWLTPEDVLNTKPAAGVAAYLKRKR